MKCFDELTEKQQEAAVQYWLEDLVTAVIEGAIRFDDEKNGDDLQTRIDAAFEKSEEMQTPWFVGGYVLDVAREELEAMARADAAAALYLEEDETPYVPISTIDRMVEEV